MTMNPTIKNVLFGGRGAATVAGDIGLAILRLGTGAYIAFAHGWSKVHRPGEWGPPAGLIKGTADLGFPMPTFFAWAAALTEFAGGILIAMGLFTRPVAAFLVFNMAVAAFGAHAGAGWTGEGSREPAMLYLLPFLLLVF